MSWSRFPGSRLSNVQYLEAPFQALHRIIPHRRPPLVGDKSVVAEIGDRIGDEPEVDLLFVVDFLPAGDPGDVEMTNVLKVVAQGPRYVAIGDLSVINVKQNLHAR